MHVLDLTVRLRVRLVALVPQIQCYIEKVNYSFVDVDFNLQTMSFEYSDNFLFDFLSLAGSEPAIAQTVVAV